MLKIGKLFKKYQIKINHFIVGQVTALMFLPFGWEFSLMVVALASISKEIWDSRGNGSVEVLDAAATILGGLVIVGLYLL